MWKWGRRRGENYAVCHFIYASSCVSKALLPRALSSKLDSVMLPLSHGAAVQRASPCFLNHSLDVPFWLDQMVTSGCPHTPMRIGLQVDRPPKGRSAFAISNVTHQLFRPPKGRPVVRNLPRKSSSVSSMLGWFRFGLGFAARNPNEVAIVSRDRLDLLVHLVPLKLAHRPRPCQ